MERRVIFGILRTSVSDASPTIRRDKEVQTSDTRDYKTDGRACSKVSKSVRGFLCPVEMIESRIAAVIGHSLSADVHRPRFPTICGDAEIRPAMPPDTARA